MSGELTSYKRAFERYADAPATNGGGRPWLSELRREAMDRFLALGFPTPRLEEWRFTDISSIAKTDFTLVEPGAAPGYEEIRRFVIDESLARLVFVDGRYVAELSRADGLAQSLAQALHDRPAEVQKHLARLADFGDHALTALNTSLWSDGAYVVVPRGVNAPAPIQLLFVTTGRGPATMTHPRNLIVVGSMARLTLIESYATLADQGHLTNAVTEMVLEDGATLEHVKIHAESEKAFHIATLQAAQGRSSNLTSHSFALSGAIIRNDWNTSLENEGAECTLNGLYVSRGRQLVDNHTSIDHVAPHCSSRELYKGILDGRSKTVFHGKITVRPDAQKSDARQTNKNLVLSNDTNVNSKPQLEIFANDVKCAHGATVGQVDKQSSFYLRSRGIDEASARRILTYAFAAEMIEKVNNERLRAHLAGLVADRLPAGSVSLEPVGV